MKPFVSFSLVFLFDIAISSALKCPAAIYEFQDKRFHFVDERLTFKQAIEECYKHGGSLAVPKTSELNEFLGDIIAGKKEKQEFWFKGFHIDGTGKKVLFTNGKTGADYNFGISARIGSGLFKTIYCLAMDGQRHDNSSVYEWKCNDCMTKKKFICEYEKNRLFSLCPTTTPVPTTTEIPTTTPSSVQTCPPDWVNFSESCYKEFEEMRNWIEAYYICQNHDAQLITIHSNIDIILARVIKSTPTPIWIGLVAKNKVEDKLFEWVDNTPYDYKNWLSGQPNGYKQGIEERCVALSTVNKYRWHDFPCEYDMPFICQKVNHN